MNQFNVTEKPSTENSLCLESVVVNKETECIGLINPVDENYSAVDLENENNTIHLMRKERAQINYDAKNTEIKENRQKCTNELINNVGLAYNSREKYKDNDYQKAYINFLKNIFNETKEYSEQLNKVNQQQNEVPTIQPAIQQKKIQNKLMVFDQNMSSEKQEINNCFQNKFVDSDTKCLFKPYLQQQVSLMNNPTVDQSLPQFTQTFAMSQNIQKNQYYQPPLKKRKITYQFSDNTEHMKKNIRNINSDFELKLNDNLKISKSPNFVKNNERKKESLIKNAYRIELDDFFDPNYYRLQDWLLLQQKTIGEKIFSNNNNK